MRRWFTVPYSVVVAAMLVMGPSTCGRKGASNGSKSAGSNRGQLKAEPAADKSTDAAASTQPGGSTGGRPVVGSLGARERKLQGTWLVSEGGDLVACFDSATYVHRAGKCTRYEGLLHTGRGKPAARRT